MSIRIPPEFAGGQILTDDQMNTLSQAIEDRAGRNGVIELEDSLLIQNGADGDRFIGIPAGTTAQRPSSPAAGYIRWNTSDDVLEWYTGSEWLSDEDADSLITFEALNGNGDVGTGSSQVARGNHTH